MHPEKRRYNILCLSGGGYRGLYTAAVLRHIQDGIGVRRLAQEFDLIIGTSTGALVGCGVAAGLDANKVEQAFLQFGQRIFPRQSAPGRWFRLLQMRPRFRTDPLADVVRHLLPKDCNSALEDLDYKLAVVALSAINRRHRIFCGKPFAERGIAKTSLLDVLLATSAAPTYFPKHSHELDILVDGGLVANAPVLLGMMLLRQRVGAPLDKIHVLHIGTAGSSTPTSFEKPLIGRIPGISWARRASDTTMGLVDLTISAQEGLAAEVATTFLGDRYVHLDVAGDQAQNPELRRLDDASGAVSRKLRMLAEGTWRQWAQSPALHAFFPVTKPVLPQRGHGAP